MSSLRSFAFAAAATLVAGCSSGPANVCDRAEGLLAGQAQCQPADGGALADGGVAILANCPVELSTCEAQDLAALNVYLDCLQGLPGFQCRWLQDPTDPAYVSYQNASAACLSPLATVSPSCKAAVGQ